MTIRASLAKDARGLHLTNREIWAALHGILLGGPFLLAFTAGAVSLWGFRTDMLTAQGIKDRLRRLRVVTWAMAILGWATVIIGTYVVYPWYRAAPPSGTTDLAGFPRSLILSDTNTKLWHTFGMEWKEHVAWAAPVLATAVAFCVSYYGPRLSTNPKMRYALLVLFVLSFVSAAIAGVFGAFITKIGPVR